MSQNPWREIATSTACSREDTENPHMDGVNVTTVSVGELTIRINQSVTREDYVVIEIDGDLTDDGNESLYVVVNDNEVWDSRVQGKTTHPVLTREEVNGALNSAADDVLDEIEADDEGARDVANLIVNVFGERLKNPDVSVTDVIETNYDADVSSVLGWCRS